MPDNCNPANCPLEPRVKALEQANDQHTQTHREMFGRLNSLERGESAQAEQYKTIMDKLETLTNFNKELNAKLATLEAKPGKRWEAIVDKVVWAVLAAVIAFVLGRVGL